MGLIILDAWKIEKAAAFKLLRQKKAPTASVAVIDRKRIPEYLQTIEKRLGAFAEQEYRRTPPEKDEIENIIARAALPKDGEARLEALIPR